MTKQEISKDAMIDPVCRMKVDPNGEHLMSEHEGHIFAVLGWRGQPTIRARSSADGVMHLDSLQLEAWQSVVLPRVWDDPDRRDTEPGIRLGEVVSRLGRAYEEWMDSVSELRDYLSDGRAM